MRRLRGKIDSSQSGVCTVTEIGQYGQLAQETVDSHSPTTFLLIL